MKPSLIITVLCTLMSIGAHSQEKTLKIEGQITNIPDGARVTFMQIEKTKFTQLGKAEIKEGKFFLIHSFPEDTPEPFVITIQCKVGAISSTIIFAASQGTIQITGESTDIEQWKLEGDNIMLFDKNASLEELFSIMPVFTKSEGKGEVKIGDIIKDAALQDVNGKVRNISDFRGKYMLIDVWGANCGPCIAAGDELREIQEKYKNTLSIVGISTDIGEKWKYASNEHNISWINLADNQGISKGYCAELGVTSIPLYILVDPQGTIVDKWIGYSKGQIHNHLGKHVTPTIKTSE